MALSGRSACDARLRHRSQEGLRRAWLGENHNTVVEAIGKEPLTHLLRIFPSRNGNDRVSR